MFIAYREVSKIYPVSYTETLLSLVSHSKHLLSGVKWIFLCLSNTSVHNSLTMIHFSQCKHRFSSSVHAILTRSRLLKVAGHQVGVAPEVNLRECEIAYEKWKRLVFVTKLILGSSINYKGSQSLGGGGDLERKLKFETTKQYTDLFLKAAFSNTHIT